MKGYRRPGYWIHIVTVCDEQHDVHNKPTESSPIRPNALQFHSAVMQLQPLQKVHKIESAAQEAGHWPDAQRGEEEAMGTAGQLHRWTASAERECAQREPQDQVQPPTRDRGSVREAGSPRSQNPAGTHESAGEFREKDQIIESALENCFEQSPAAESQQ